MQMQILILSTNTNSAYNPCLLDNSSKQAMLESGIIAPCFLQSIPRNFDFSHQ